MLFALLHNHLFDLVKAVELITGISVLFGIFTPLMILVCMPVAWYCCTQPSSCIPGACTTWAAAVGCCLSAQF
jgi:hypothetical protein